MKTYKLSVWVKEIVPYLDIFFEIGFFNTDIR